MQNTLGKHTGLLKRLQKENGAMDGYCGSRLLESTLTLHVLQTTSLFADRQESLKAYVTKAMTPENNTHATKAERIMMVMAAQVLHGNLEPSDSSHPLLQLLKKREEGRKLIYFGCLLAETSVVDFSELPFSIDVFEVSRKPMQTWAYVMLTGLKVLYCYGTSNEAQVTENDIDFLKEKLFQSNIFESNVLTQIVGILALSKVFLAEALERPIAGLLHCLRPDGGIPLMTGLDNFVTPLAGLAVFDTLPHLSGKEEVEARSMLLGMADYLAGVQAENGGWSYMKGTVQTDIDDSGLCAAYLSMVDGNKYEQQLKKAGNYLLKMQNEDGGFPTYIENNPSTPSMTAAALHGMAEMTIYKFETSENWKNRIRHAVAYLGNAQDEMGTFERRWSNSETHAMYRVAMALKSVQQIDALSDCDKVVHNIFKKMTGYLEHEQNSDGGWGQTSGDHSDTMSTAYAVLCCTSREIDLATKAIGFLDTQQLEGHSFSYRPDLLGPRPLPYDIPTLVNVTVLHAYSHYTSEILQNLEWA